MDKVLLLELVRLGAVQQLKPALCLLSQHLAQEIGQQPAGRGAPGKQLVPCPAVSCWQQG